MAIERVSCTLPKSRLSTKKKSERASAGSSFDSLQRNPGDLAPGCFYTYRAYRARRFPRHPSPLCMGTRCTYIGVRARVTVVYTYVCLRVYACVRRDRSVTQASLISVSVCCTGGRYYIRV